jgi:hypothetical protein
MAKHQHNRNGGTRTYDITVGNEIVTYEQTRCTCGQVVETVVIHREPK